MKKNFVHACRQGELKIESSILHVQDFERMVEQLTAEKRCGHTNSCACTYNCVRVRARVCVCVYLCVCICGTYSITYILLPSGSWTNKLHTCVKIFVLVKYMLEH